MRDVYANIYVKKYNEKNDGTRSFPLQTKDKSLQIEMMIFLPFECFTCFQNRGLPVLCPSIETMFLWQNFPDLPDKETHLVGEEGACSKQPIPCPFSHTNPTPGISGRDWDAAGISGHQGNSAEVP